MTDATYKTGSGKPSGTPDIISRFLCYLCYSSL